MATSHEGNEGNVGNRGRGALGVGPSVLPDRVDLPWATYQNMENKRLTERVWPDRAWEGAWFAWPILADFAQAVTLHKTQHAVDDTNLWLDAPQSTANEDAELDRLIKDAEAERADALGEIIAQHEGFIDYFHALMCVTPQSHPLTCRLLHVGSLIGAYVSMHFKMVHKLRRPAHRAPALMPPVPMPGHPSYPSGHATQAYLMAGCVEEALDKANVPNGLKQSLQHLAKRIARNREIAGLHYTNDTDAGQTLAGHTLSALKKLASFKLLVEGDAGAGVKGAKDEWP